jgi:hypothetical protein
LGSDFSKWIKTVTSSTFVKMGIIQQQAGKDKEKISSFDREKHFDHFKSLEPPTTFEAFSPCTQQRENTGSHSQP